MNGSQLIRVTRRSKLFSRLFQIITLALVALLIGPQSELVACPFCSAVSQTFAEEIDSLDAAVLVKLIKHAKRDDSGDDDGFSASQRSEFEVLEVLKGEEHVKIGDRIKTHFFGKPHGGTFIVMGTGQSGYDLDFAIASLGRRREIPSNSCDVARGRVSLAVLPKIS